MSVRNKSKAEYRSERRDEFLRQLQYNWTYPKEIAELLLAWNEKISDIKELGEYLKQRWCDESTLSLLLDKYIAFLKQNYLYWEKWQYTQEIQYQIEENDNNMKELKENILEYWENEWSILSNPKEFIKSKFEDFENSEVLWSRNIDEEVKDNNDVLQKNLKEYDDKNRIKENLKIEISNYENKKLQYKSKISQFFHKKEIINITDKIREKNEKLNKLEDEINILKKEIEKLKIEKNNLSKILKFVKNDKMCLSNLSLERLNNSNFNRNQLDIVDWSKINENLLNLKENLQIVLPYLNKEYFNDLYSRLSQQLIEQFEKNSFYNMRINRLELFINMYIKLFFTWNINDWSRIPTLFSKKYFDRDILEIIEQLDSDWKVFWHIERDMKENQVDYWFINDIFVHQSNFRVIDEIIDEWWLVSTNEIWMRKNCNKDIDNSLTQTYQPHKDIYFSRWFADNHYGKTAELKDSIFFVNTMANFAREWYWVPVFQDMQINSTDGSLILQDTVWYSIISQDVAERKRNYSKIKLEDLYIFVPESKKNELENIISKKYLGKQWDKNYKIVYIPEELYKDENSNRSNTYEIYEFMKKYIDEQSSNNTKIMPRKIIKSNDANIESINSDNKFAFCEAVSWEDIKMTKADHEIFDDEILCQFIKRILGIRVESMDVVDVLKIVNQELENGWINGLSFEFPIWLLKYWILSESYDVDENLLLKLWYSRKEITIIKTLVRNNDINLICNLWSIKIEDMQYLKSVFTKIRQKIEGYVMDLRKK